MNSACDVQRLLQDRGIGDDYPQVFAFALRHDIVFLPPSAKSFDKEVI